MKLSVLLLSSTLLFAAPALLRAQQASAPQAVAEAAPVASLEAAQALAAHGHLDAALEQLRQLSAQRPVPAAVTRLQAMILYQKEDLNAAIEGFAQLEQSQPEDREILEMHGVALFRRGQSADAIPLLEKAHARVAAANIDPEYVLALCYIDVKRYDDARRTLASYWSFAPESAEAHLLLARFLLRRGRVAESADAAAAALHLRADLPEAHQLLGESALAAGDFDRAIAEFEAERRIDPLKAQLYERLGDALVRKGEFERARTVLNQALLLEPNATAPYILLGQSLIALGQPLLALHYLDHALKMDPANYITHNLLAQAYKAIGDLAAANREFKTVAQLRARIHQEEK